MQHCEDLKCSWQKEILLAPYSTYKVGGPAKLFTKVVHVSQLQDALKYCHEQKIPFYILGKGSNTLFDDLGFNGAVILNAIPSFEQKENLFEVGAGLSFAWLGMQTAKLGYGGLEYAAGIPATVGGAVFMNAGANGQEIAPLVEKVTYVTFAGELQIFDKTQIQFEYRKSSFQNLKGAIANVTLKLALSPGARERQIELIFKRKQTQPLNLPSCGCVFKNGADFSTGMLVEQLGLKGMQIGGAQVSTLHANYIVNIGHAKANDIKALIAKVEEEVYVKAGKRLEKEVRFVPFEGKVHEI